MGEIPSGDKSSVGAVADDEAAAASEAISLLFILKL
jgi:hypothetical protein